MLSRFGGREDVEVDGGPLAGSADSAGGGLGGVVGDRAFDHAWVRCTLDTDEYPTGISYTDKDVAALPCDATTSTAIGTTRCSQPTRSELFRRDPLRPAVLGAPHPWRDQTPRGPTVAAVAAGLAHAPSLPDMRGGSGPRSHPDVPAPDHDQLPEHACRLEPTAEVALAVLTPETVAPVPGAHAGRYAGLPHLRGPDHGDGHPAVPSGACRGAL